MATGDNDMAAFIDAIIREHAKQDVLLVCRVVQLRRELCCGTLSHRRNQSIFGARGYRRQCFVVDTRKCALV